MAIDLKELLSGIQSKIGGLTPSSPSRQLEFLAKAAVRSGENLVRSFDSDAEFLDSATTSPHLMLYHTTDKNIYMWDSDGTWKPISGTVELGPTQAQGSTSGFTSGGIPYSSPTHVIDKFPFASNSNATDVANMSVARYELAGQSSSVSGYNSGGNTSPPTPGINNVIDKYPFASGGNSSDVGDLTMARKHLSGQTSTSSGYTAGGEGPGLGDHTNRIDKFPFSSDANASDVGDLSITKIRLSGQSSADDGYASGGYHPAPNTPNHQRIDKFPFSSDANATNIGNLTQSRSYLTGQQSNVSGYSSGGHPGYNRIDKFSFSSDGNATDVGDLSVARGNSAGQSSTDNGYTSGGGPPNNNVIDKFPFAADGNATDVGDLSVARFGLAGQQV